jgi:recombinational DNA repair protein RecT
MKEILSNVQSALQLLAIPEVKNRFLKNYSLANGETNAELVWTKNSIILTQKFQNELKEVHPVSAYQTLMMIAAKGYDLEVTADEVYLVPQGKVVRISEQAGYHIRKLKQSGQIKEAENVQLIYDGDEFSILNGDVVKHERKLKSNKIIAAYVRFITSNNNKKCFIYTPDDWYQWKAKSQTRDGGNWTSGADGQPNTGFLKTKIALHAAKEKTWWPGKRAVAMEYYPEVIDSDETVEIIPNESNEQNDQSQKETQNESW